MLPFFRKIRYRLAEDNQFFKYSRYAIGEIVLVVVGILIALYINNWNEQRKERVKFDQVLIEVQKDLTLNIEDARLALDQYQQRDSLICLILYDTLTKDFYQNDIGLVRKMALLKTYSGFTILSDAYEKLLEIKGNLNPEQDSILQELTAIYREPQWGVDKWDNEMYNFLIDNTKSYHSYPWYNDYLNNTPNDQMFDFFLNDPRYKKDVGRYSFAMAFHRSFIERFDIGSLRCYTLINNYIFNKGLIEVESTRFSYDANDFNHYIGKYANEVYSNRLYTIPDSTVISSEGGKLYFTPYFENGRNTKREIIPVNKWYFRTERGHGYYRLIFDENENVKGIQWSNGNAIGESKKIR